jgi:hypothetical protein
MRPALMGLARNDQRYLIFSKTFRVRRVRGKVNA